MNVNNIVQMSLKQLGVLAAGENAEAGEVVDAIYSLQSILAQWATMRLYVHKAQEITLNLTGTATISPDALDNPTLVASIQHISDTATLDGEPIRLVRDTNTTATDPTITYSVSGNIWTFNGTGELKFKAFSLPYALEPGDELVLPPQYERALFLTLAVELAPMFGLEPTQMLLLNQRNAVEVLKRSNITPLYVKNDLDVGVSGYDECY